MPGMYLIFGVQSRIAARIIIVLCKMRLHLRVNKYLSIIFFLSMYSYGGFYYSKQCPRVKVLMKVAIQFDTLSAMEIQTIMHTQINAPK